jgi:hypothetical protein
MLSSDNLYLYVNCKESILFVVESICRKKWKNIRDTYRKCKKRRDLATRSDAGYKRLPECGYFNELSFLRVILWPASKAKATSLLLLTMKLSHRQWMLV